MTELQYRPPAQKPAKSQILFHKNSSPHDLYKYNDFGLQFTLHSVKETCQVIRLGGQNFSPGIRQQLHASTRI